MKELRLPKSLRLYWFSGSGNTLLAAETFSGRLRELGWDVQLMPIEKSAPSRIDPDAILGLAFPTHCFSIPETVRNFVRNLPENDGIPAMMLGTHGLFSGGVLGPMKRILSAKGFRCISGRIFGMPDSFFPFGNEGFHRHRLAKGLVNVGRYADDFDALRLRWSRWPVLSDLFGLFFATFFASRTWFRNVNSTVHVDGGKCIRCGHCVRLCPQNALRQNPDTRPSRPNGTCVNCLRCVAVCPTDAMRHLIGFHPYRAESAADWTEHLEREIHRSGRNDFS